MNLLLRLLLATGSGLLVYASYEPLGWWFSGILGMALLYVALAPWSGGTRDSGPRLRTGVLLAFAHAMTLYLLLLPWIGELVGTFPYVALAVTESLYAVVTGLGVTAAARLRVGPVFYAFITVAVEWLRSSWPFGGFPWVRLAWGQIEGPLRFLAPLGGPASVTFGTVMVAAGVAALLLRGRRATALTLVAVPAVAAAGSWASAPGDSADTGRITVAAVQGNVPRLGLDFNAQRRAVLANHTRVTETIGEPVDLVVWPENSADVNPFADPTARALVDEAVNSAGAPILVGTLTRDDVGDRNTVVVFDPVTGPGEWHHKKYLQPFGEWMPYRDLLRPLSPYVDRAGDYKPGDGDGVVHIRVPATGETVGVGVATCYEVSFDAAGREAVRAGARLLTTPTNNATFGFSDMTYQQLAMSRMRALELDRAVVVAATSGVSAIIQPDGHVTSSTRIFTPAVLTDTLPLRDRLTFAARHGSGIELTLGIIGWICLFAGFVTGRRERKPRKEGSGRATGTRRRPQPHRGE
ncbi:apolipoprotein N-acyltransferase [Corynebacterium pygosceleis]|uniref:Apolipoprotein N-acyltransferase n=1 Tax=Corynebacterium pygosceleis TaxID=2800406 RepID=A0A9Q4C7D5_9CORY|nr:apolipoprotein N-acyltransferase [Corynebacterium pygosceleis]MCK7637079.1 apolipoprotein N-acyltransferase [Corynebacterium pygosceleis]MCL0120149.1 apolipoprotein N-acyltransferase [Corynebacterium pygosceleis]MCX7467832.1 apolipoprotein N-acyltransferase [Corynebacterium pygosceleis]